MFMALSADTGPHFTTIADFIASLEAEIVSVFRDVLLVCDEVGLIGREMFAVDGAARERLQGVERHASGLREEGAKDGARHRTFACPPPAGGCRERG